MGERKKPLLEQELNYEEMLREFQAAKPGKEAREFHKKYKKYGWGLCFCDRYPNFDICMAAVALAVSLATLIFKIAIG